MELKSAHCGSFSVDVSYEFMMIVFGLFQAWLEVNVALQPHSIITGGKGSVKVNGKTSQKTSTLPLRAGDEIKDASDLNDSEKGVMPDENLNGASVDAEMGNTPVATHELRPLLRMLAGSSVML
ncbi:hypothetical protein Tco_0822625 [Tanacetum coccineum]|uniref:Uncharacterized protein n=1 Tax=Tanacetum coccineum TaxID=301880 RepID=A0ABQ5AJS8_9ASTR